jgi:hypothetical protein
MVSRILIVDDDSNMRELLALFRTWPLPTRSGRRANASGNEYLWCERKLRSEYALLSDGVDYYFTSFRREKDGIWICVEPVTIRHPAGRMEVVPGSSFKKGTVYMGVDVAALLDEQLMNVLKKRS